MEASTLRPSTPTIETAGQTTTRSAAETREVGRRLGASASPGTLLALHGTLGAGKTELTKGVAEGLGVRSVVNSPTFILMNEHVGRLRLFHVDAYRLTDPDEARAAGLLDERQAAGVTVIEWAERLDGLLPGDRLDLTLEAPHPGSDERVLQWRVGGARHARLAAALTR